MVGALVHRGHTRLEEIGGDSRLSEGERSDHESVDKEHGAAHHQPQQQPSGVVAAASIALYAGCSVFMNFANKGTLMVFNKANSLLLLQMVFAVAILWPLQASGTVSFPPFQRAKAVQLLPVTIFYTANVAFSLLGLTTLNIPMYQALKRLTPVVTLVVKTAMTRKLPPWQIAGSVVLLVVGCIIASMGDLTYDFLGYCYALASCLLQATYLLLVEFSGTQKDTGSTELMYYNSLLSLPLLCAIVLVTGEAWSACPALVAAASKVGAARLAALVIFSCSAGVLLNFSLFWCTQLNDALTTTVVGALKSVLTTLLGFFLLGGVRFRPGPHFLGGIALNLAGGVWYSAAKYASRRSAMPSGVGSGSPVGGGGKRSNGGVEEGAAEEVLSLPQLAEVAGREEEGQREGGTASNQQPLLQSAGGGA